MKTLLNFSFGRSTLQFIFNKSGYYSFKGTGPYIWNTPFYISRIIIDSDNKDAPIDVDLKAFQVVFFYFGITFSRYTRLKDESTSKEA